MIKHNEHNHSSNNGEHNCGCHDHNHENEHKDCSCKSHSHTEKKDSAVNIMTHGMSVVGSVCCNVPLSYNKAVEDIERRMNIVAEKVKESGGFIGHIKAIVQHEGDKCRISITDESAAHKQWLQGERSKAECVFIVLGIKEQELEGLITGAYKDLL